MERSMMLKKPIWMDSVGLCIGMLLLMVLFFTGCRAELQPSFEGVFVHSASSEFSEACDTLRIEKTDEGRYVLRRSTGIILIDGQGKKAQPIIDREIWNMELDVEKGLLLERSKGRQLWLERDGLRLENAMYKRLP
ncbi:hypothetical protein [Pedobacter sp.]